MDKQEALSLLGVESGDKLRDVRRKYHLLMHMHHPDALSGNGNPDTARKLNEAFGIIKREGIARAIKAVDWGIDENGAAFCKRKLYMEDNLFGDEIIVDTGAFGKYYWQPDMESFRMLLKSIGEAVNTLLDDAQGITKAKLLHLLIQEFIDPYECIGILYPYEGEDGTLIQTYRIKCQIRPISKDAERLMEREAPEIRVKDSRLHVFLDSGEAGQIVFTEDRLYYLVTPLFLQKAAKAELEIEGIRHLRKSYMDATMILNVDPSKKSDMTEKINEEITRMLKKRR
ncbi:MAG: hypothetical protein IJT37_11745 [Lachnospiraceae bacterium]|nr:hypothetical protein [Lachnospiraceae bacterium]